MLKNSNSRKIKCVWGQQKFVVHRAKKGWETLAYPFMYMFQWQLLVYLYFSALILWC